MKRRTLLALAGIGASGCQPWPSDASDALAAITGGFTGIAMARGHQLREGRGRWEGVAPARTHRTGVLIAGGGVAGLAAARALRLRGIDDFALLELEDSAGGNSRGGMVKGIACPLGAHYLPVPGDDAPEVQDLLVEFGLAQRVAGRWQLHEVGERHLCHSPQERIYVNGQWQSGLLPVDGVGPATLAQYRRFAQAVAAMQQAARFAIPMSKVPLAQTHLGLDAMTFEAWLNTQDLHDPHLRWYLDYCCRDDYGAGLSTVSAWAGLHYFASRHGFRAPQDSTVPDTSDTPDHDQGVLTWPEGNAWLTHRLAAPLGERLRSGHTVVRIAQGRHSVEVDAFNTATQAMERWQARACIVALPVFLAARVVHSPWAGLGRAAQALRYAPWLVANLHLRAPLQDHPGAPPSWDNVIYTAPTPAGAAPPGLGYVDATHQGLNPAPHPTVLTHYRALGLDPAARRQLYQQPWSHWRDTVLGELAVPHPDLVALTTRIDITRYGHAMAVPVPGLLDSLGQITPMAARVAHARPGAASQPASLALYRAMTPTDGRMAYAHSDWSGYSIFEEAFTRGHAAGFTVSP